VSSIYAGQRMSRGPIHNPNTGIVLTERCMYTLNRVNFYSIQTWWTYSYTKFWIV